MRRIHVLGLALACLLILPGFQNSKQPTAVDEKEKIFSAAELLEDLERAQSALENGHPTLTRYRTRQEIEKRFQEAREAVRGGMTDTEFYRSMWSLIAYIADGHTEVAPSESMLRRLREEPILLGLRPVILQKRMFVLRNYSSEEDLTPGSEILSLDGVPTPDVLTHALQFFGSDGYIQTRKRRQLEQTFYWFYPILKDFSKEYRIEYRPHGSDRVRRATVPGISRADLVARVRERYPERLERRPVYEYESLPDHKAARMTIRTLDVVEGSDFAAFLEDSFKRIQQDGVEHLVLDLRDNPGGRSRHGIRLYSYFTDRPFKYYEHRYIKKSSSALADLAQEWSPNGLTSFGEREKILRGGERASLRFDPVREPAPIPFSGRLYVLINGGTFSAAAEFAALARHNDRAVFIGEETGGAFAGNSSGITPLIPLPHSGISVVVPLVWYEMAVTSRSEKGRGVIPDYPVERNLEDLLDDKDTQMDFALRLIQEGQQQPASSASAR